MWNERCDILNFSFHSSGTMNPFKKSFYHFKLQSGLTQKWGGWHLLPFFPFSILESELISSNSLFFTKLFRANVTARTCSNSTMKLHWLFTKEMIARTTSPTSLWPLIFYSRPTVIYLLVFLPSVVSFYKKTSISSNITKPSLKNISLMLVGFLFSFKLKIIPNYCSRCIFIRFLERIDSSPIRLIHLSESERSNPSPLWKSWRKKSVPMETEGLSDMKIETNQQRSGMKET